MKVSKNNVKTLKNFLHRNPVILFLTVVLLTLNLFNGCEYEQVKPVFVDTTKVISFKNDIVPIFTANCISCHKTGGTSPDFSSVNAYTSIKTMALIDTLYPDSSKIYQRITKTGSIGSKRQIMPPLPAGKMPDDKIATILNWIKQGGKDN